MSKEYNLAGKNLMVDGITILGTRKSAVGTALTNAINTGTGKKETAGAIGQVNGTVILVSGKVDRLDNDINGKGGIDDRLTSLNTDVNGTGGLSDRLCGAENDIDSLETVTKRFDVSSNQTSIIRDDAKKGFQTVVLHSTVIGYENPNPALQIMTNETYYRICAIEANPSQATIEALTIGALVNPKPTSEGSWYRGGQLFSVGDHAMYILYTGSVYITVELVITAKTDSSVTGTIVAKYEKTAKGVDDRTMTNVTLYIPYRRAAQVEASLYNGKTLMDQLTIPVTDNTRRWKELPVVENKLVLDYLTEDKDGLLIDGDCCIVKYEYNPNTQAYDDYQLNTYILKNGSWVLSSDKDAAQQIQTIYTYMGEAAQYKITHPEFNYQDTVVGSRGVFAKMMAGIIYAGQIFANEIRSTGYAKTAGAEFPTSGFRLSTQEDLIEAVRAVFKSARIKDSSLEDVTISIKDDATSKKLLVSTLGITPPANPITMAESHETGYYVESSRVNYKWNNSLLSHCNRDTIYSLGHSGQDSLISFTAQNDCIMEFRSSFIKFEGNEGSFGTRTTTVVVNGTTKFTETMKNENYFSYTTLFLKTGDAVEFSVSYKQENLSSGLPLKYFNSKIIINKYKDRKTGSWVTLEPQVDKNFNAYCIEETASAIINQISMPMKICFPIMDYADHYVASELDDAHILVNDTTAANEASLVKYPYDAIKPLTSATGLKGGVSVRAIPRNVWINTNSCTLRYKKRTFAANQLYLSEAYAVFAYNGAQICTISVQETSTLYYSVKLNLVDPSLTVGDLLPGSTIAQGGTDLGATGNYFDNAFIGTIHAGTITRPTTAGDTLTINADTVRAELINADTVRAELINADTVRAETLHCKTVFVTSVYGDVNSKGTKHQVWGAVVNPG